MIRRAQSYSDFHDAVKAVLGKDSASKEKTKDKDKPKLEDTGIKSELDFADWYYELELDLLNSSHDDYTLVAIMVRAGCRPPLSLRRAYQTQLELSKSHLDSLLLDTSSTLDHLASLTGSFKEVEAQTTIFRRQCEGLLDEQKRVSGLADQLDHNLKYYNFLEPVTRRLNAPGAGNFVRSKEFSEMLARLDDCLEYMATHVGLSVESDGDHC